MGTQLFSDSPTPCDELERKYKYAPRHRNLHSEFYIITEQTHFTFMTKGSGILRSSQVRSWSYVLENAKHFAFRSNLHVSFDHRPPYPSNFAGCLLDLFVGTRKMSFQWDM
jgi:hypothetical protein